MFRRIDLEMMCCDYSQLIKKKEKSWSNNKAKKPKFFVTLKSVKFIICPKKVSEMIGAALM